MKKVLLGVAGVMVIFITFITCVIIKAASEFEEEYED